MTDDNNTLIVRPLPLAVAIVFTIMVLVATHIPQTVIDDNYDFVLGFDKLAHIFVYAMMAALYLWSFIAGDGLRLKLMILLGLSLLGAVDEYTQSFFGRNSCFVDWLANFFGAAMALSFIKCQKLKK